MKAQYFKDVKKFTDIPNVGPRIAGDFKMIGIIAVADLKGRDGFAMYTKLCKVTGVRHDPCVLDTFLAVADFVNGAPARPWFWYTKMRKEKYPVIKR